MVAFQAWCWRARKDFVERYGMDGEFWLRNPRAEQHTAVVGTPEGEPDDLAQYYHAEAQKDGEIVKIFRKRQIGTASTSLISRVRQIHSQH